MKMNTGDETRLEKMVTSSLKVRPAQRREWCLVASHAGYDCVSEFIRACVDRTIRMGAPSKSDIQELTATIQSGIVELSRVGNNLNQIAKHANSTGDVKALDAALKELSTAVRANMRLADTARSTMTVRLGTPRKWKPKKKAV